MSRQRSLRMDEHFDRFIDERIESDDYASAEAVVEAGLRLLEQQEAEMRKVGDTLLRDAEPWTRKTLAAAIDEGLASGEAVDFDIDRLFEEVLAEAGRRS